MLSFDNCFFKRKECLYQKKIYNWREKEDEKGEDSQESAVEKIKYCTGYTSA